MHSWQTFWNESRGAGFKCMTAKPSPGRPADGRRRGSSREIFIPQSWYPFCEWRCCSYFCFKSRQFWSKSHIRRLCAWKPIKIAPHNSSSRSKSIQNGPYNCRWHAVPVPWQYPHGTHPIRPHGLPNSFHLSTVSMLLHFSKLDEFPVPQH